MQPRTNYEAHGQRERRQRDTLIHFGKVYPELQIDAMMPIMSLTIDESH